MYHEFGVKMSLVSEDRIDCKILNLTKPPLILFSKRSTFKFNRPGLKQNIFPNDNLSPNQYIISKLKCMYHSKKTPINFVRIFTNVFGDNSSVNE